LRAVTPLRHGIRCHYAIYAVIDCHTPKAYDAIEVALYATSVYAPRILRAMSCYAMPYCRFLLPMIRHAFREHTLRLFLAIIYDIATLLFTLILFYYICRIR